MATDTLAPVEEATVKRRTGHVIGDCAVCPCKRQEKVECQWCGSVVCRGCSVRWFENDDAGEMLCVWCKACYEKQYPCGGEG